MARVDEVLNGPVREESNQRTKPTHMVKPGVIGGVSERIPGRTEVRNRCLERIECGLYFGGLVEDAEDLPGSILEPTEANNNLGSKLACPMNSSSTRSSLRPARTVSSRCGGTSSRSKDGFIWRGETLRPWGRS